MGHGFTEASAAAPQNSALSSNELLALGTRLESAGHSFGFYWVGSRSTRRRDPRSIEAAAGGALILVAVTLLVLKLLNV
jgi:hypothetical protein